MEHIPFDYQDKTMRRWWCNVCNKGGEFFDAGEKIVYVEWERHVREHEDGLLPTPL